MSQLKGLLEVLKLHYILKNFRPWFLGQFPYTLKPEKRGGSAWSLLRHRGQFVTVFYLPFTSVTHCDKQSL